MTISAESAQALTSALARERQASADAAASLIEAEHIEALTSNCVNIDTRKVARITFLPPTNPNHTLAAQQLMWSVK